MRACLRALEVQPALLVFVLWLLPVDVAVIEHVDSNKISHLRVHLLSLAQLEGQILILVFLVAWV